jgi:hypothetical protein
MTLLTSQKTEDLNFAEVRLLQQLYTLLNINTLNAELNPICHLLALLGAHYILHIRRIRLKKPSTCIASFFRSPILFFVSKPAQCSITFPVINAVYPTKSLPSPIFLYLSSLCFRWLMFLDLQGLPTYFSKVSPLTGP